MKKLFATVLVIFLMTITSVAASAATPTVDSNLTGVTVRTAYADIPVYDSNIVQFGSLPADTRMTATGNIIDDMIEVSFAGSTFYVKSIDCLINIKQYDDSIIVNLPMASGAIFKMADEAIPNLTGVQFYHNQGSCNGTEAWLRYEVCKKLVNAQKAFQERGLSIVVEDAYRPYDATKSFQYAYRAYLNTKSQEFKNQWFGSLGESWFLAQKASAHNFGVAVDITLCDAEGNYLVMPSAMHTLDCRSAFYMWNDGTDEAAANAWLLRDVMVEAGFTTLKSEWWHFQDNSVARGNVINIAN